MKKSIDTFFAYCYNNEGKSTDTFLNGECVMEQENGSKLLKVVSIIMIIGGIVCAVGSLIMPLRVSFFS